MKLKIIISSIIAMFVIVISSCVFAATGTVDFKASTSKIKKGETFTVTLSARSEDGINGVDTKYTYNTEKLELVSAALDDSTKWASLGSGQDITIISNFEQSIKNANLYVLTFKVKDNVAVGDVLKVETNEILLDTDAQENSEVNIGAKKAEVTVIEAQVEEPKQDEPAKQEETSKKSDDNTKKSNEINENLIRTITTEDNKSEETVATKELPKTGLSYIVVTASILVAIVLGIVFYKKDKSIKLQ